MAKYEVHLTWTEYHVVEVETDDESNVNDLAISEAIAMDGDGEWNVVHVDKKN